MTQHLDITEEVGIINTNNKLNIDIKMHLVTDNFHLSFPIKNLANIIKFLSNIKLHVINLNINKFNNKLINV